MTAEKFPVAEGLKYSPLQVPKASQILAKLLMSQIARREIAADEYLPSEPEMMTRYDVSRPTLREAMRILETQGLLTTTRGGRRGARVHYPTTAQAAEYAAFVLQLHNGSVMDVMQLASFVTPSAARLLAEQETRPNLSRIFADYKDIDSAIPDPRAAIVALHRLEANLCAMSGNHAIKFIAEMASFIVTMQIDQVPAVYGDAELDRVGRWDVTYRQIGAALRSIEAGNAQQAESLMHGSLADALVLYREFLADQSAV